MIPCRDGPPSLSVPCFTPAFSCTMPSHQVKTCSKRRERWAAKQEQIFPPRRSKAGLKEFSPSPGLFRSNAAASENFSTCQARFQASRPAKQPSSVSVMPRQAARLLARRSFPRPAAFSLGNANRRLTASCVVVHRACQLYDVWSVLVSPKGCNGTAADEAVTPFASKPQRQPRSGWLAVHRISKQRM